MKESIFLRGASQENKEAKKILRDHNVIFVEVYSNFRSHRPVLFTEESAYAYKGLAQIREYASSVRSVIAKKK